MNILLPVVSYHRNKFDGILDEENRNNKDVGGKELNKKLLLEFIDNIILELNKIRDKFYITNINNKQVISYENMYHMNVLDSDMIIFGLIRTWLFNISRIRLKLKLSSKFDLLQFDSIVSEIIITIKNRKQINGEKQEMIDFFTGVMNSISLLWRLDTLLSDKITNCAKFVERNDVRNYPKFIGKYIENTSESTFGDTTKNIIEKYASVYKLYLSLCNKIIELPYDIRGHSKLKFINTEYPDKIECNNPKITQLKKFQCYYRVKELAKYSEKNEDQGTELWLKLRENKLTASPASTYLNQNKYKTLTEFYKEKVGLTEQFTGNEATLFGNRYEPIVSRIYTLEMNRNGGYSVRSDNKTGYNKTVYKVYESSFIKHRDPRFFYMGCSPDNLVLMKRKIGGHTVDKDGFLLEIKSPKRRYPNGKVPPNYYAQMQIQMEVCNVEKCYFLDYKFYEYLSYPKFQKIRNTYFYKGCILEIITDNKYIWFYSPIYTKEHSTDDVSNWRNKKIRYIIDQYGLEINIKCMYWILTKKYEICVYRNRKWFADNVEQFRQVWLDLGYYKHNFCELLDDYE